MKKFELKSYLNETVSLSVSAALLVCAAGLYFSVGDFVSYHFALVLSIVLSGWRLVPKASKSVLRFRFNIYVLIVVAVIGAIILGEWFEAALASLLFSVSGWLENYSQRRAHRSISALLSLTPDKATVLKDGHQTFVAIEDVLPGSQIMVRPGDRVPIDGTVIEGKSFVDESALTGESNPQTKNVGDSVLAGSINQDGLLVFESNKRFQDSIISKVTRLVESAKSQPTTIETTVESFSMYYTPFILVIALSLCLGGGFITTDWSTWFYRALVILVVGCPCAFLISTPVAMVAALSNAARNGVVIKGGRYLEQIGRTTSVYFDKTGALTEGRPIVNRLKPVNGYEEEQLLSIAGALCQSSSHPLSQSIWQYCREKNASMPDVTDYENLPGRGVTGSINRSKYWLGSLRLIEEQGFSFENELAHDSAQSNTMIAVANSDSVLGLIYLNDPIRGEAQQTVQALRDLDLTDIAILTGDRHDTAQEVADYLCIQATHSELLPQDKAEIVQLKTTDDQSTLMIGDGINDAPALASATVGIAIGARGSDIAIESAPITLLSDDLTRIPWLISLSRRARWVILVNIMIAIGIKFGFVLLAAFGYSALWAAVMADVGAALLVILNSMRLLHWKQ